MDNNFKVNYVVIIAPSNCYTWRKNCKPIKKVFYKLIKIISKYKKVILLCNNAKDYNQFLKINNVEIYEMPSNDSWARDVLPFKVLDQYVGFNFNGYNGILQDYNLDSKIGEVFCKTFNLPFKKCDLIFEGGGIVSNGKIGIVTEQLMFNRNPFLTKTEIETKLKSHLNLKYIIWLKKGLFADETCGHADEVVAFKSKNELLLGWTDNKEDENYLLCRENYNCLVNSFKEFNLNIKIYKLIGNKPLKRKKSEAIDKTFRNINNPVAISYINFLMLDNVVIMPQYGVKTDRLAYKQFKQIFKNYKIIKFKSREINLGGGGIHCVTKTY